MIENDGQQLVMDVEAIVIDGHLPAPLLMETSCPRPAMFFGDGAPRPDRTHDRRRRALGARSSALGASILTLYLMFGPDTGVHMKKARIRSRS